MLVDPLPGTTLFDLGGLQLELEELLGVTVNLLTPGDLPNKFREQVLAKARSVYEGASPGADSLDHMIEAQGER